MMLDKSKEIFNELQEWKQNNVIFFKLLFLLSLKFLQALIVLF